MRKRNHDNSDIPVYIRLRDPKLLEAVRFAALAENVSMNDFCVIAIAKRVRTVARRDPRIKMTLDMAKAEHSKPEADELEDLPPSAEQRIRDVRSI